MSITPSGYVKARAEIVALFGWSADSLSPDQTLRLDCAVALRLALDDLQGRIVRGESADVARMLTASEALARLLPPAVLASPPAEEHGDPRQVMLKIYMEMRKRGEVPPEGWHQHRINELEAEITRLRGAVPGCALPSPREGSTANSDNITINPTEADITPPGEIGTDCYAGIRPGPDDPPRRPPPVIDAKAVPNLPAAPAYDYNREQGWKDYVEPDGTIRTTPRSRGHYRGPV
jgi:hypothetical protein